MQPRSSNKSQDGQISVLPPRYQATPRQDDAWMAQAGPSRPRVLRASEYDGRMHGAPHHASPGLTRSPDEYDMAGRTRHSRASGHRHASPPQASFDARHDRPYVSPVSPDRGELERYAGRVEFSSQAELKGTSRPPTTRDDGLPHQSILDARYGSTAYQHDRPAYGSPRVDLERPTDRHAVYFSPVALDRSPQQPSTATQLPPVIDLDEPRQRAYQQARLEHILMKAGRKTDRWPPVDQMAAVLRESFFIGAPKSALMSRLERQYLGLVPARPKLAPAQIAQGAYAAIIGPRRGSHRAREHICSRLRYGRRRQR